jgi:hypothetical protein
MRQAFSCGVFLFVLALAPSAAQAQLCKYVDEHGHITYSDGPVKGAKKESCFDPPPAPPPPPPAPAKPAAGAASSATPTTAGPASAPRGGLPNVDPTTQKKRDDSRRKIIEDELVGEERPLAAARKALSEGEAVRMGDERNYQRYLDRIQGLKDRVAQHERNVAALRQELANLR